MIMLNHAAWVNEERGKERYEASKKKKDYEEENPKLLNGLRADELSTDDYVAYFAGIGGIGTYEATEIPDADI